MNSVLVSQQLQEAFGGSTGLDPDELLERLRTDLPAPLGAQFVRFLSIVGQTYAGFEASATIAASSPRRSEHRMGERRFMEALQATARKLLSDDFADGIKLEEGEGGLAACRT